MSFVSNTTPLRIIEIVYDGKTFSTRPLPVVAWTVNCSNDGGVTASAVLPGGMRYAEDSVRDSPIVACAVLLHDPATDCCWYDDDYFASPEAAMRVVHIVLKERHAAFVRYDAEDRKRALATAKD